MTMQYPSTPVLVVLVNNQGDWQRVVEEHWYRIPVGRAPHPVAASYLAFYQSRIFGSDAFHIRFYAPIQRYRIVTRRELLPLEGDHPRADEKYYRVELGPLQELAYAIPSHHLRRISFIPTTLRRLLEADEINDLWLHDDVEDILWELFYDAGLKAVRRLEVGEGSQRYIIPLALPGITENGGLAVFCDEQSHPPWIGPWQSLRIAPRLVYTRPDICLASVQGRLASRNIKKHPH